MSAFRFKPGTRTLDLRRYPSGFMGMGREIIREEDYDKLGAGDFYDEYGTDPIISDLLDRYQYATYGSIEEANPVSTFNPDDPDFRKGPIRDIYSSDAISIFNMPDIENLPITSIDDLKRELELGISGQGYAAPQISEDETSAEEERLERFKLQAMNDLIGLKSYLGEDIPEELYQRQELQQKIVSPDIYNYGDFTPIDEDRGIGYRPIIRRSEGGNAEVEAQEDYGIGPEGFSPEKSDYTEVEDKDKDYDTAREQALVEYFDPFMQGAYSKVGAPIGESVTTYQDFIDREGIAAGLDPFEDRETLNQIADLQRQAVEAGYTDLTVSYDPETDTFSYDSPSFGDALNFGLGQIGRGIGDLANFGYDMYQNLTSLTPLGLLRDTLMGDPKLPGGRIRSDILGRSTPYVDPKGLTGLALRSSLFSDPVAQVDLISKIGSSLSDVKDKAVEDIKNAFGVEIAEQVKKDTDGMTEQEFQDYMERTFGSEQSEGLYEDQI